MKRNTRVRRHLKNVDLKASAAVKHYRSANEREKRRAWINRQVELRRWRRLPKKRITMDMDADVLAWFREKGPGCQWEINKALRKVMMADEKLRASGSEPRD